MAARWIVLDCNYLCWRAFFTTGSMEYGNDATGVVYGFLRNLGQLENRFDSNQFMFCFDHADEKGKYLRHQIYPQYKANRSVKVENVGNVARCGHRDADTEEQIRQMRRQVSSLRTDYLPRLGYRNVFSQPGYEADDLMAALGSETMEETVHVSADKDLYQLLKPGVIVYHPRDHQIVTYKSFEEQYGIGPALWPTVKALAGCPSDNVRGVKGIGELSACRFLNGDYQRGFMLGRAKTAKEFMETEEYSINLRLTTLPYGGCLTRTPVRQPAVDPEKWQELMDELGIKTVLCPGAEKIAMPGTGLIRRRAVK